MTRLNKLNTVDDHQHHHGPEDDEEEILETLPATIFDASYCGEAVTEGFDTVRILIDGRIEADLSWKKEQEAAKLYVKQGLRILWEIDLGLPASFHHALSNRSQFLSLCLSLEHFRDTLWKEFRKETVGLCLYRGTADFSANYPWDEEQETNLQSWIKDLFEDVESFNRDTKSGISDFSEVASAKLGHNHEGKDLLRFFCRDAIGEYLNLLASRIPDNLPVFILFDIDGIDPFVAMQLVTKERYPRFHLALKNTLGNENQILGGEISWQGNAREQGLIAREKTTVLSERSSVGFCLPKMSLCRPSLITKLRESFSVLQARQLAFRIIPEVDLAAEWDGLDDLIVDTQVVDIQFKRKLQGFCAAGGTVVFLGESIGLAQEVPFAEYLGFA